MQKWEYCVLAADSRELHTLSPGGRKIRMIRRDEGLGDSSDNDAFNRTFAQLGLDGWEMVNADSGVFWFKRPVEK
ncbi:MAG TPA: hypothetical protein ENO24_00235 [Chloroflexi bacterium]|nr:hypothetical protein [Chloroflexota bacterium]